MECLCGFKEEKRYFGKLEICGESSFVGSRPERDDGLRIGIGSCDVYICPNCGLLYCDPRRLVENTSK